MGDIVGVTGTPGTGKKSVAPIIARALHVTPVDLGAFARSHGFARRAGDELEVDTEGLRESLLRSPQRPCVLYGHLLPHSLPRKLASRVVVLRTEPSVLKERLASRGYPPGKVLDDVEAELIGVVSSESYKEFGKAKTFEVDTTYASPDEAARSVLDSLRSRAGVRGRVDWTTNYATGPRLRALLSVD